MYNADKTVSSYKNPEKSLLSFKYVDYRRNNQIQRYSFLYKLQTLPTIFDCLRRWKLPKLLSAGGANNI